MKKTKNKNIEEARRKFLKKSVYSVPGIIALGTLVSAEKAEAGSQISITPWK